MADTLNVPRELYRTSVLVPRLVDAMVLGAGTEESYTVPSNTEWVLISCDNPIFIRVGATAAAPTTEVADGTASFYIPSAAQFAVEAGTVLHMIRAGSSSTIVTIGRYSS